VSLWRLEWLRLVRTHRLTGLVAVFLFFGFTGPLTTRYLEQLLERFGGGVEVRLPTPVPADGMAAYVNNGQQLGLVVVVVLVAAGALAFDAQRESAAFLRTRVSNMWRLVLPKVAVNALAAAGAFALGALAAWYETAVLLGGLPAAGTLAGIAYVAVYLAFAVALTALAAALLRGVVGTALAALAGLLLLGLVESLGVLADWLPSHLVGSLHALAGGGDPGRYLLAAAVTLALGALAVTTATWRLARRDL
jgi:ABC-2 type transport system permease protein